VSYSLSCAAPGCRFARLLVRSLAEAEEIARQHSEGGHAVEVSRETVAIVATVGGIKR
jgi:hypothetical protein